MAIVAWNRGDRGFILFMNEENKRQLGDRVPVKMADALRQLGRILKVPKQQLTQDAIALWMGQKEDPMARTRREMAIKAMKSGKVDCPTFTTGSTLQAA